MRRIKLRSYLRFLVTYFLVLVSTLALLLPVYYQSRGVVRQNIINGHQNQLDQTVGSLQQDVAAAFAMARKIATDTDFQAIRAYRPPADPSQMMTLLRANEYLADSAVALSTVECLMAAFSDNDIAVTSRTVYYDYAAMYSRFYYAGALTYPEWREQLFRRDGSSYRLAAWRSADSNQQPFQALTVSIPAGTAPNSAIVLTAVIDIDRLIAQMDLADALTDGFIEISAAAGRLLYTTGDPGNRQFTLVQSTTTIPGLLFTLGIPESLYQARMASVTRTIFWYFGAAITLGILLSLFFAWHYYRSMASTLTFLEKIGIQRNGLRDDQAYIHNALTALNNMKNQADNANRELSSQSAQAFLEKLIRNGSDDPDRDRRLTAVYPQFQRQYRLVLVLFQSPGDTSHDLSRVMALLNLNERFRRGVFLQLAADEYVVIIPDENEEPIRQDDLEELARQHEKLYAVALRLVISRPAEGATGLHACYASCTSLSRFMDEERVVIADHLQALPFMPDPQDLESIRRLVLEGQAFKARQLVFRLWHELSCTPSEDPTAIGQLYYKIRSKLEEAADQVGLTVGLPNFDSRLSLIEQAFLLTAAIDRLAADLQGLRRKADHSVLDRLMAYMQEQFRNPEITVQSAADRLNLSRKTVDRLCKAHTGTTFFEYLETLRLQEAARLLRQTDLAVNDVAQRSGFATASTFYKSFRRQYAVSPSTYRADNPDRPAGRI